MLEKKVLWLSTWIIHHANHIREGDGELKVGGHQASCASMVTIMTALYFAVLKPEDRVAIKPHGSPVFHTIQYLFGKQDKEHLARFRALGGAQSYPSRTKDIDDVDFSTGSVGLGVAMTSFAALIQDYLEAHSWRRTRSKMVCVLGDAELDEGNIYEALLEGWKHSVRDLWWIVDYNRQSLDAVISDRLLTRFHRLFVSMGWEVVTIKYGKLLHRAFVQPGGEALRQWIDSCPNSKYSTLVYKGGEAWREALQADIGSRPGVSELLGRYDDRALNVLMTNLGGHCIESMLEAFEDVGDDKPTCFFAYTIKGFGLPLAGHKDNHAGMLTPDQIQRLKSEHNVDNGEEWSPSGGTGVSASDLRLFIESAPFFTVNQRRKTSPVVAVPDPFPKPDAHQISTQEAFGRILASLARQDTELAQRIITVSPDVTVSTNLSGWVNQRGLFHVNGQTDMFTVEELQTMHRWRASPTGQHIELGIAENNLFLLLAAAGLSHSIFGERLLPIGTIYDPFIERGLDALNYACYQDARFLLVATPSGISLAPEGGAHQSIGTPLIGMSKPGLASFEPAFTDELSVIMRFAFSYLQREETEGLDFAIEADLLGDRRGGSVYLRLTTRRVEQIDRAIDDTLTSEIIEGGYWLVPPQSSCSVVIAYIGAVAPQVIQSCDELNRGSPGSTAVLAITSADRLHRGWMEAQRMRHSGLKKCSAQVEKLLGAIESNVRIVTVTDGYPSILTWLGAVAGHRVHGLGVDRYGESGTLTELYQAYRLDAESILSACRVP
ncbi:MAG TPA: transketolase [Gammaproteobacteria bacterium]|nr:transketolase [Gammaproteobacteria bacterium]